MFFIVFSWSKKDANSDFFNVRKEMKCSGDSEVLHEIVRDTSQKSEKHELIRV